MTTVTAPPQLKLLTNYLRRRRVITLRANVRQLRRARLLKLSAWQDMLQQQSQMLKLGTWQDMLQHHSRMYRALTLFNRYFPAQFRQYYPDEMDLSRFDWYQLLAELTTTIRDNEVFPVNWNALNDVYRHWMETIEPEALDELAEFLYEIPIAFYGFTDGEAVHEYPFMWLLHHLLAKPSLCASLRCEVETVVATDVDIEEDVLDRLEGWTETDWAAAWLRLRRIENEPEVWSEPLQWLPLLANWACHQTGNPLLDLEYGYWLTGCRFTWDDDFDRVIDLWQRAKPVVRLLDDRLAVWYMADPERAFNTLARFVMNGTHAYELDW